MATRERRSDRGRRVARASVRRLVEDIRLARIGAGLSQRAVAADVGVSHSRIGRLERGEVTAPSTDLLGAVSAVVGLELSLRAYPAGDPLRDRAHAALLDRFRHHLHRDLHWRTEVPLPGAGDLRAWDAEVRGRGWRLRVEAETKLLDGQALERRLTLKVRDGGEGHVALLIAKSDGNRHAARRIASELRDLLPLDSRTMLRAVRAGVDPGGSGIVIL